MMTRPSWLFNHCLDGCWHSGGQTIEAAFEADWWSVPVLTACIIHCALCLVVLQQDVVRRFVDKHGNQWELFPEKVGGDRDKVAHSCT
jgi:hypothetical protein